MTEIIMEKMLETPEGRRELLSTPEGRAFYENHIPVRLVNGPVIGHTKGYTKLSEHLQVETASGK